MPVVLYSVLWDDKVSTCPRCGHASVDWDAIWSDDYMEYRCQNCGCTTWCHHFD